MKEQGSPKFPPEMTTVHQQSKSQLRLLKSDIDIQQNISDKISSTYCVTSTSTFIRNTRIEGNYAHVYMRYLHHVNKYKIYNIMIATLEVQGR